MSESAVVVGSFNPQTLLAGLAAAQELDSWLASSSVGYYTRLYGYFYGISILASCWVFYVARGLRPGLWRALACLPVCAVQLAVTPYLVDRHRTPVLIVPVMGLFSVSAFKVAAYAFGRGPLALKDCPWLGELKKFGAVLSFPIIPKAAFKISKGSSVDSLSSTAPTTPSSFLYSYGCKSAGAAAAGAMAIWPALPILVNHWFYALTLSLSLGAIWDFWCFMTALWFGVEPAPSFDKPWLSTSFADYWSRRWNLTVTYMLRVLIYEPVMEGRLVPADAADTCAVQPSRKTAEASRHHKAAAAAAPAGPEDDVAIANGTDAKVVSNGVALPSSLDITATAVSAVDSTHQNSAGTLKQRIPAINGSHQDTVSHSKASSSGGMTKKQRLLRRLAALQATFAFSGIWHLLIFYYATGLVTWHWFAFFSLQAPIMAAEAILIKYAKSKNFVLPRPVAIFLTNFLLIVVANPLFFGPCDWSGMCTAIWANVKGSSVE